MHRNRSVRVHDFAMSPRADIPRSSFRIQKTHKTTFDAGYLIPIWLDEVLPGDTFNLRMTAFCRLATPLFPIMDNMYLDTFFFFVPNRLVWNNWQKFMGEQENPGDSTSYIVPEIIMQEGGYSELTIHDYMGLPTIGQYAGAQEYRHQALFHRAYNLIWNEWFRDQNLQDSLEVPKGDGPDLYTLYNLKRRGKRHDYFTSALPWPQKGQAVQLPLGEMAPIVSDGNPLEISNYTGGTPLYTNLFPISNNSTTGSNLQAAAPGGGLVGGLVTFGEPDTVVTGFYADLSTATAATVNTLRQSFQIQKLLERDARGGTRYTEKIRAHFGVISPDARLQRPEYLGGGSTPININPIAQTNGTGASGTTTPQGNLAAMGTALSQGNGFSQSFTEHGMIIGLCSVRADLNYQQGVRKMWNRSTIYDFYWPAFAMLGEQAVLNREIFIKGDAADDDVWGYQERWAEYRYNPSQITGLFRSTCPEPIDQWHLAQLFTTRPTLNATFIEENPPLERILAVGEEAGGQQFLCDAFFDLRATRPMPMYSVPGLIDHF